MFDVWQGAEIKNVPDGYCQNPDQRAIRLACLLSKSLSENTSDIEGAGMSCEPKCSTDSASIQDARCDCSGVRLPLRPRSYPSSRELLEQRRELPGQAHEVHDQVLLLILILILILILLLIIIIIIIIVVLCPPPSALGALPASSCCTSSLSSSVVLVGPVLLITTIARCTLRVDSTEDRVSNTG